MTAGERSPEQSTIDEIERVRDELRGRARAQLGVTGQDHVEPMFDVLRRHKVGLYPLIALGLLAFVDGFQGLVLGVLGPEVARALGVGPAVLASLALLKSFMLAVFTIVFADIVGKRPVRATIAKVTAIGWSIATLFTGLVRTPAELGVVNAVDGATSGSVAAVHTPLIIDTYPPAVRVRMNALRTAFLQASALAAPLMVTLLVGVAHLTWRGTLIVLGSLSLVVSLFAMRLRDPGYGRWDTDRVRELVHEADPDTPVTEDPPLGFFEASRRLWLIPTMRKILVASIVGSMGAVPVQVYFAFFLADRWNLGPAGRGLFSTLTSAVAVAAIPLLAPIGDRLFARDPSEVLRFTVRANLVAVCFGVAAILSPFFGVMIAAFGLAHAIPNAISPAISVTVMNIIPGRMRSHLIALLQISTLAIGGSAGTLLLSGLDRRIGLTGALLAMNVPAALSLLLIRSAGKDIGADLDATVEHIIETEEIATMRAQGHSPPLLACRNINFSYGQLQVLFDVAFTVDDGEMVALLGTNGAGKSTLLGVISGLNLPSSGTVRLNGADITFVDPERRVGLGVAQVIGGRSVFGPLTVAENLRVFGFSHGKTPGAVRKGIDDAFAAFPRLEERRNQLAATLSGGEQQMLGLSQALILKPRLLCIDELSLGLAPKVVGELLGMVRRINAAGTAVVLVEQSATIALSLVDHAYFMERGQIRFDGRAADLLRRDDLLRSVFLKGTAAALRSKDGRKR